MRNLITKIGRSNFGNAILYAVESITAILFAIVSIALVARHFGPEVFSRYTVMQSVSTALMVVVTLGLDQFIVRDLVRNLRDEEYISTAFFGMGIGWGVYVGLVVLYYALFRDLSLDLLLIVNMVVGIFFLKVVFIKSYLQANNRPGPIAWSSVLSRLVSVAYLLTGSALNFSFDTMMMYMPIQACVLTICMAWQVPEFFGMVRIRRFNYRRMGDMLVEASPVFFSTLLFFFFNQSDVLIMSGMLPAKDVGTYSAAIRIIPQAAFIGYVLVATFYTQMDRLLHQDREAFMAYVKLLLTVHFVIGLVLAVVTCIGAKLIIFLLYGARYADSSAVLAISCWSWVFVMPAALYSRLLIMLGYVKYELIKMLIVAPLVLALNYWSILHFGINGCAVVLVLSYLAVDLLVYFLFRETRQLAKLGMMALVDLLIEPRKTAVAIMMLFKARHGQ